MSKYPRKKVWQQIRKTVWQRDKGICHHCHKQVTLEEYHCDHIIPKSEQGSYDLDNLRTLCRRCHILRANSKHRGMIAKALFDGIVPANWRELVWE